MVLWALVSPKNAITNFFFHFAGFDTLGRLLWHIRRHQGPALEMVGRCGHAIRSYLVFVSLSLIQPLAHPGSFVVPVLLTRTPAVLMMLRHGDAAVVR
jgi:hypothetical protein